MENIKDQPIHVDVQYKNAAEVEPGVRLDQAIARLLVGQPFAVLATRGPSGADASLVTYAPDPAMEHLVFATPVNTSKFRNIEQDSAVALLIDDRSDKDSINAVRALTVTGSASAIRDGMERSRWASILLEKHPGLAEFLASPSTAVIVVDVARYVLVTRFQEVFEWSPGTEIPRSAE